MQCPIVVMNRARKQHKLKELKLEDIFMVTEQYEMFNKHNPYNKGKGKGINSQRRWFWSIYWIGVRESPYGWWSDQCRLSGGDGFQRLSDIRRERQPNSSTARTDSHYTSPTFNPVSCCSSTYSLRLALNRTSAACPSSYLCTLVACF